MRTIFALSMIALFAAASETTHADNQRTVVVTMSNATDNQLLVYDTAGTLVQSVPTLGQGGVGGNAGGVATRNGTVAVVNYGSQTVTVVSNSAAGFERSEIISTISHRSASRSARITCTCWARPPSSRTAPDPTGSTLALQPRGTNGLMRITSAETRGCSRPRIHGLHP